MYGQSAFDAGAPVSADGVVGRVERAMASVAGSTLMEIAAATGDTAFRNDNNLFQGRQRAFANGRDYYTLAYVSADPHFDGKFRAITVQVAGRKCVRKPSS